MCLYLSNFQSKDGFPVQQYNVAEDMFDYSSPENSCFEYNGKYPMKGVFSTAPCQSGEFYNNNMVEYNKFFVN